MLSLFLETVLVDVDVDVVVVAVDVAVAVAVAVVVAVAVAVVRLCHAVAIAHESMVPVPGVCACVSWAFGVVLWGIFSGGKTPSGKPRACVRASVMVFA
jgi:hypothetical protein